jgi:hypothetical protein
MSAIWWDVPFDLMLVWWKPALRQAPAPALSQHGCWARSPRVTPGDLGFQFAREYLHYVDTFVGAQEVQEIFYLRDHIRALIKLVAELKA